MRKRNEAFQSENALICSYCHHEKSVLRHVHWLKVFEKCSQETSQELYPHLLDQYRHNGEPWAISVITWCHTMRSLWGDIVDASGVPMPLWRAWIVKKTTGTEVVEEVPF